MAQELSQKSEEIRKYHAEQAVVFRRIRELVGQPAEIANKARLYDQLVGSGDPVTAQQTIPILVKYSQLMNNLFEDIQRVVPPDGTPRRVLYQGPPGSPNRDPLRGRRRGSRGTQPANSCGTGRRVKTREFRKGTGKYPLLPGQTEEYRVR